MIPPRTSLQRRLSDFDLSLAAFRTYVEGQDPNALAGRTCSSLSCPIQKWMVETLGHVVKVFPMTVQWTPVGGRVRLTRHLPDELQQVIRLLDGRDAMSTAATFAEVASCISRVAPTA